MPLYSAADIVGKTLIAARPVNLTRLPNNTSEVIYTVPENNSIGVVYSYVNNNGSLYWQFFDKNNTEYYSKHEIGAYLISGLISQGVITTDAKTLIETKKNETTKDFIERNLKYIALLIGGVYLLTTVIKTKRK